MTARQYKVVDADSGKMIGVNYFINPGSAFKVGDRHVANHPERDYKVLDLWNDGRPFPRSLAWLFASLPQSLVRSNVNPLRGDRRSHRESAFTLGPRLAGQRLRYQES